MRPTAPRRVRTPTSIFPSCSFALEFGMDYQMLGKERRGRKFLEKKTHKCFGVWTLSGSPLVLISKHGHMTMTINEHPTAGLTGWTVGGSIFTISTKGLPWGVQLIMLYWVVFNQVNFGMNSKGIFCPCEFSHG